MFRKQNNKKKTTIPICLIWLHKFLSMWYRDAVSNYAPNLLVYILSISFLKWHILTFLLLYLTDIIRKETNYSATTYISRLSGPVMPEFKHFFLFIFVGRNITQKIHLLSNSTGIRWTINNSNYDPTHIVCRRSAIREKLVANW